MGSYLQQYGVGEERRNRIIKWLILAAIALLLLSWFTYVFLHDYSEKQIVKHFLAEVNAKDYQAAYRDWGCTDSTPCRNYDFTRFMSDWADKKATSPWKIDSVEGCNTFVTVNVAAQGTELQSLGVERGTNTLMYAPGPECQERKWRWKAFFQRLIGRGSTS